MGVALHLRELASVNVSVRYVEEAGEAANPSKGLDIALASRDLQTCRFQGSSQHWQKTKCTSKTAFVWRKEAKQAKAFRSSWVRLHR